jgi:ABC-2 type transport system ATP-binding protein
MTTSPGEPAIESRGLRKEFGGHTAVHDLTLTVGRGEVFGFLGPNGAGKTTSVKMLLGLVRPTAGAARRLGAPVGDVASRARVGFLPEHCRFQDWLTARELLTFHGRLYGMKAPRLTARIGELLERVGLEKDADRRLNQYSKGMRQRAGLAQALLNEPELVFLDEPTSGLDPIGVLLVRDVIHELRQKGTAVFLNSHLLSEVEVTCDRVAFVRRGRVVRETTLASETGRLEVELKIAPVGDGLLDCLERFGENVRPDGDLIRLEMASEEDVARLTRFLVERGVAVYRVAAQRASLESTFLEIMREEVAP